MFSIGRIPQRLPMTPEDKALVALFMAAQAQPEGRLFSENILAGCLAVRSKALEEAAKECEEVERMAIQQPPMVGQGCQACAIAIRALAKR